MEKSKKKSLKLQIYDEIKDRIIRCEYLPGQQLNEDILCSQFGSSRTPVRDALSRLEQEGLVNIHAKRGVQITDVSISAVNELFEVRMRIEPYAVRTYGSRQNDDVYAGFMRQFKKGVGSKAEFYALDNEFHRSFIANSGNRYLNMIYNMTADQSARFRILSGADERLEQTQEEHYRIAACCLRRDWVAAANEMRAHLEMSKKAIINYALSESFDAENVFTRLRKSVEEN